MTEHNDRRRFSRVHFDTLAEFTQEEKQWQSELLDISLKGLLVKDRLPTDWDKQKALGVKLYLSDHAIITMAAQVVHQEEHQTGLACLTIDLESMAHLRRLIELNLGDTTAAERELTELIATFEYNL